MEHPCFICGKEVSDSDKYLLHGFANKRVHMWCIKEFAGMLRESTAWQKEGDRWVHYL